MREGTLLAKRAHETALHAEETDKPWVLEQPHWRPGKTSMFALDEFQDLLKRDDVKIYTLAQCRFGAQAEKLTDLLSNRDLSDLELRCNHPTVWWRIPWSGEWIWAAHPPLKGRQLAVRAEEWNESMLMSSEPSGPYVTRAFAAYPPGLNEALAEKFATWLERKPSTSDGHTGGQVKRMNHDEPHVDTQFQMPLKLRPQQPDRKQESDLWSLRNVYRSMTGRSKLLGIQIGNLIERELDANPGIESTILNNFGKSADEVSTPHSWLDTLRNELADLLQRNRLEGMPEKCDVSAIDQGDYKTVVRGRLLEYWAKSVGDPAASAASWLHQGAPAGLEMDIDLKGICAEVDDDSPELDDVAIATDFDTFQNYDGVESNSDAVAAIKGYHEKGYLLECRDLAEARRYLGKDPAISKLGCIVKEKLNVETGQLTKKTRIILDCKRSMISRYASRKHKSVLPRVTDAVRSALKLLWHCNHDEGVTLFIADVSDAFWLIPLHKSEQKYFVARLEGRYYIFLRTAQGSRGAPLTCSVIMALASRFIQSILCSGDARTGAPGQCCRYTWMTHLR